MHQSSEHRATVRIADCAGLLASVARMLGFYPTDSFVGVFLSGSRVAVTMRMDWAQLHEAAEKALLAARQTGADGLVVIGYGDELADDRARALRTVATDIELGALANQTPVRVHEVIEVGTASRTWRTANEPAVVEDLDEVENHPVAAQWVYDGTCVAASRAELAKRVEPGSDALPKGFAAAFKSTMQEMASWSDEQTSTAMAEQCDELLGGQNQQDQPSGAKKPPSGAQLGRLVALATHDSTVEPAMAALSLSNAKDAFTVWSAAARCSEGRAAFMPVVMSGMAAWLCGDGATLNVAGELAERIDRHHFLVEMVNSISQLVIPPESWEAFRLGLSARP